MTNDRSWGILARNRGIQAVIPVELCGGPWDGVRFALPEPLPPDIQIPLTPLQATWRRETPEPATAIRTGRYTLDHKEGVYDRISVSLLMLEAAKGDLLGWICQRAQHPQRYMWEGEA
jgi:hypothetical protein